MDRMRHIHPLHGILVLCLTAAMFGRPSVFQRVVVPRAVALANFYTAPGPDSLGKALDASRLKWKDLEALFSFSETTSDF